jgi:hypothetical protein
MIIDEDFNEIEDDPFKDNKYHIYTIITKINGQMYIISTSHEETDKAIKFVLDKMIEELQLKSIEDIKKFKEEFRSDNTIVKKCRTKTNNIEYINIIKN